MIAIVLLHLTLRGDISRLDHEPGMSIFDALLHEYISKAKLGILRNTCVRMFLITCLNQAELFEEITTGGLGHPTRLVSKKHASRKEYHW